jgi:hypothetical protein
MSVLTEIVKFVGLGFGTYVHKLDLGNSYKKIRAKETDQFLKFKDRGTPYIILKTVPAKVDFRGNKQWFLMESDVHTYDPESGEVLDPRLEGEFKKRLLKNELEEFKELIKGAQQEAIRKRTDEIYDSIIVRPVTSDGQEDESKSIEAMDLETEQRLMEVEFNVPTIKIGRTLETRIENLTPHDTINEVMSMILDGTVLKSLITPPKLSIPQVLGVGIVGLCVGWILIILYAVMFPNEWALLVGK